MKNLVAAAWLVLVAHTAWGQQHRLPQDEARRYAKPCAEQAATLDDLPIKMDVDPEKPCAERGEGGGAMVIPAKRLEAALPKVGQGVKLVGQSWLRKWTVVVAGKPIPRDKLRIVTVSLDDQDPPLSLLLLEVRRPGAAGGRAAPKAGLGAAVTPGTGMAAGGQGRRHLDAPHPRKAPGGADRDKAIA